MTTYEEIMRRTIAMMEVFTRSKELYRFVAEILPLTPGEVEELRGMGLLPEISDVDGEGRTGYSLGELTKQFMAAPGRIGNQGDRRLY